MPKLKYTYLAYFIHGFPQKHTLGWIFALHPPLSQGEERRRLDQGTHHLLYNITTIVTSDKLCNTFTLTKSVQKGVPFMVINDVFQVHFYLNKHSDKTHLCLHEHACGGLGEQMCDDRACAWTQFYILVHPWPVIFDQSFLTGNTTASIKKTVSNYQHLFHVFKCPVRTKTWNVMTIRLSEPGLHFSERKLVNRTNSTGTGGLTN